MKINVPAIPEEGQSIAFDQSTPWFAALLTQRFSQLRRPASPAGGEVQLRKTLQNVAVSGEVELTLTPACARCGVEFQTKFQVPLLRNLAPYFSGPREDLLTAEEEVELSAEDLEFSFYHGEEFDLSDLVAEEIFLAMPMRFLCQESCRGLCPKCGVNLNRGPCSCPADAETSPFAVLKGFKLKS